MPHQTRKTLSSAYAACTSDYTPFPNKQLVLPFNFGNNKASLTIFGTAIYEARKGTCKTIKITRGNDLLSRYHELVTRSLVTTSCYQFRRLVFRVQK